MHKANIFILIGATIVLMSRCSKLDSNRKLAIAVEKLIEQSGGIIAVAFEDLITGETLFINEKEQMHAASTMKTPVMIEVFKQANQNRFHLSESLVVKNEFRSIVDGSTYSLDLADDSDDSIYQQIGKKMSIRELVFQMITVSSNLATNILIELIGADNVMKTMKEIGAKNIQVLRGVEDNKAYERGLNNTTDGYDMLLVMKAIALKKVVTPEACDEMIAILSDQKFNTKIPALLPDSIKVAHKTGSITAIDHDAAIVYPQPDHPYVLVILTKGLQDHEQAEELIAKISRIIFDAVLGSQI